jgi:hypothetical protein
VVALPQSPAVGQSTKLPPRNTLFRLTRASCSVCTADIEAAFATMSDSDLDRLLALTNLSNIRRVLKRPNLASW